jgi:Cu-Zn family superoxide dismutase
MIRTVFGGLAVLAALAVFTLARAADDHGHKHAPEPVNEGVALLVPMKASGVAGTIVLKQGKGSVQLSGEVTGLKPGKHGFHIHMFGDLRAPDGISAGGHYNPHGHPHGGPEAKEHHEGDLGNLDANDQGVAKVDVKADHVELADILGRSLVVHADADDLKTQPAGNAGPRIAIGVIGRGEVKAPAAATKK